METYSQLQLYLMPKQLPAMYLKCMEAHFSRLKRNIVIKIMM